jgi:SSS family solute:Na+ symporter/sodium/pantothenate symporter
MGDLFLLAQAAAESSGEGARWGTIVALVVFIVASVWLGTAAQKVMSRGSFLKGFFLGNRGLGAWAIALTATVQSGGTFMGFPSLVYTYGWIVALWIGSYMVVPITGFGIVGKRIAQISRKTGAITMPDLFRERFGSPTLGIVTSLLIVTFMSLMMVAQFKAGASLMSVAWPKSGFLAFTEDANVKIDVAYYVGLTVFSVTVIGYTLVGGFLAAVWTDLFQSVLMFIGVLLLLFLSLNAAGGLESATRDAIKNPDVGPGIAFGRGWIATFSRDAGDFFLLPLAGGRLSPASVTRIMACKTPARCAAR